MEVLFEAHSPANQEVADELMRLFGFFKQLFFKQI